MRYKIAKQARRHKIGNGHIFAALANGTPVESVRPSGEVELSWLSADDRGVELEIIAVVTTDSRQGDPIALIIHCFPTALKG